MVNLYEELVNLLSTGQRAVLARIVRQVGSAPRALGAKCVILEDGSVRGTIGGGCLELQVMGKAKEVLKAGKTHIFNFRMDGKELAQSEMLCGGIVDVLLEPIWAGDAQVLAVFDKANALIRAGKKGTLFTVVLNGLDHNGNFRMLMGADGSVTGDIGSFSADGASSVEKWLGLKRPAMIATEEDARFPVFAEPVEPDAVLYLFGAGHIATFVAPLAKMVGFRVCVIDDREEFANSTRFPNVDEIIVCPFHEAFTRISVNASSYIAIITRGHIHDRDVLRTAMQTGCAYIGMIGSIRKRQIIYASLMAEGISKESLADVHSPIGVDIAAETPEEIAVSIVAELIQARVKKPTAE